MKSSVFLLGCLIAGALADAVSAGPILIGAYDEVLEGSSAPQTDPRVQFVLQLAPDVPLDLDPSLGFGVDIWWEDGDVGVLEFTVDNSPGFESFADIATDGIDERFASITGFLGGNHHGVIGDESHLFGRSPDLVGYKLDAVRLLVQDLTIAPILIDYLNGYSVESQIRYEFYGTAIPEPSTLAFLIMGATCFVIRDRRSKKRVDRAYRTHRSRRVFSMFAFGLASIALSMPADAGLATFDSLAEGFYGETELIDGGIRFFNPDDRAHGPGASIAIDDVSEVFPYFAEFAFSFSNPSVLTLGWIGPGPSNWAGARFGEIAFMTGDIETLASVDVFHLDNPQTFGTSIVLEAFLAGESVGLDSVLLESCCYHFDRLTVSGVRFDTLVLQADGAQDDAFFFGAIDNVVVVPDPAPIILLMLAIGAFAAMSSCSAPSTCNVWAS